MKSYVFSKDMEKCYPFRARATKSFIGASTHFCWNRNSIAGTKHAMAVYLLNKLFIDAVF